MYKISKIGVGVLAIIGAILWVFLVWKTDTKDINNAPMSFMFIISYILIGLSVLLLWILPVVKMLLNNQSLKAIIYFISVLLLLVYIYCISTGLLSVDAQLILSYIIIAIAVLLLVVTGVKNTLTK